MLNYSSPKSTKRKISRTDVVRQARHSEQRRKAKGANRKKNSHKILTAEHSGQAGGEGTIASIKSAAGIILGVTENRAWIELFFEGDLMHTKTVDLPAGSLFDIYIENIPHKTTVYEHPRTMIVFSGPCDLEITREGNKIIVMGAASNTPAA